MRLAWPFVGRGEELRRTEAALFDREVAGLAICGPAGVGKSRLAREALDAAAARGCRVRRVAATSCARELPLGALAPWAESPGNEGLALVCGVIDGLTAAPAGVPVVIGVDDAHLLDELSMFVVHQIVHRRLAKVLLTVRDDQLIPVALQELWTLEHFDRLELEPLSAADTTSLLQATLNGPLDPRAAHALWQRTHGNALYLRYIVEQDLADGRLASVTGRWQWSGELVVPRSLIEMIESHIGALPPDVGAVIDTLAVCEPIDLAALEAITGQKAVEDADTRGLLRLEYRDVGIDVRAAHPLYTEVRRQRAAPTRLRRLRGLVVAQLSGADNVQGVVRRASLAVDSDVTPDAELLLTGARGAICLADLPLADRLAGAALRAGGGVEAQFLRAHALSWLGRGRECEEVLSTAAVDGLSDEDHARFTYLRASNLLWALGDPVRAKAVIEEGAARVTTACAHMCIDAIRTVYWFAVDRPDAALKSSAHLVIDDLPPIVGAETTWALASIHGDAGRTADALAFAEAGYAIASRCWDAPHMTFNIADAHVGALVLAGRINEAQEFASRAGRQAADLPGTAHSLGPAVAGRAALGAGRLDEATSLLGEASKALSATGHEMGWGYRYSVPYVTALAMKGLVDEAAAVLEGLNSVPRPFRSLDYERTLASAWVAAGLGVLSEATSLARTAAECCRQSGRFAAEVICLQTAAQFGDGTCEPRLRELEGLVEGPRAGIAARFAEALSSGEGGELEFAASAFERIGDLVATVDAASQASIAFRRKDLRGSAIGSATRAGALARECGADTPVLRQAREPLPLTDREREIALLLSQGMSNRDIAARLTLSIRTVENNVYKAMSKTGTKNRAELAALLGRRPVEMPSRGLR